MCWRLLLSFPSLLLPYMGAMWCLCVASFCCLYYTQAFRTYSLLYFFVHSPAAGRRGGC